MTRQPPAVRFQADNSNDCWHFDLSPSDLKHISQPAWVEPGRGNPLLMLYSVVDDRSGMCYQEYHCVYGEDVEAALRFLFNAMTAKTAVDEPFQGIPASIYADNGPISKSHVFQNVLSCLGIELMTHMPKGSDGRRVTARAKGKVERPFRTVKEAHETLYHFMKPFYDPDPYLEFAYPTTLAAKLAIADYLGQPLAKLQAEQREFITALVEETLTKKVILERVRQYFQLYTGGEASAD